MLVKEDGVIAGVEVAKQIFKAFSPDIEFDERIADGTFVKKGDIAFYVKGAEQIMLQAERLVLNVMQRMSGIATQTKRYCDLVKHTNVQLLDTRKTTPLNRYLEKQAVKIGGGTNHRFGLFDMIMIKDNHVDFSGSITKAVSKVTDYLKENNKNLDIEVEVRSFEELDEALKIKAIRRIMLDNFSVEDTRKAVEIVNGAFELESSGGITLDTIKDYAETGVDFISVGALTHQIKSLDLSLKSIG